MSSITDEAEELTRTDEERIQELAALSPLDYDRKRKEAAEKLECRPATLDKLVAEARASQNAEQTASELVSNDEPWSDPVDGIDLLREIVGILKSHAILPKGAAEAIALWIVGSYGYDSFRIFPKLLLSSPEKRCGKSTLLEIVRSLSHRALMASNITPSAIFRCIDAWKPTLLIDEADTFVHGNEELRGIINSGHTRSTAFVIRVVGDDHEPKQFSTWAPMVLAMIKLPPDTILDRSVTIPMRRKLPGENIKRLPVDFPGECRHLRSQCLRWANDHGDRLKGINPTLPASSNDRALDNWTPLLAIAEAIGGKVPAVALESFKELQGAGDDEDDGIGPTILRDIRTVFDEQGKKFIKMHSEEIVNRLVEMEGHPWAEWKHGKPMTANSLARLLKPFKIKPDDIRDGVIVKKGYKRAQFDDAFARYLADPPNQTATPLQPSNGAASSDFQTATQKDSVADSKSTKPSNDAACSGVADQNPVSGQKNENQRDMGPV